MSIFRKLFLVLAVIHSISANANNTQTVDEILNQGSITKADYMQCAVETCGPINSSVGINDMLNKVKNGDHTPTKEYFDSNIKPLIDHWFNYSLNEYKSELAVIDRIFADGINLDLEVNAKYLVNFLELSSHLYTLYDAIGENEDAITYDTDGVLNFNLKFVQNTLTQLTDDEIKNLTDFIKAYHSSEVTSDNDFITETKLSFFLKYKYPSYSHSKAAIKDASITSQSLTDIEKALGQNLKKYLPLRTTEKVIKGKDLNSYEQALYANERFMILIIHEAFFGKLSEYLNYTPKTWDFTKGQEQYKKDKSSIQSHLSNADKIVELKQNLINKCYENFHLAYHSAPTQKELYAFGNTISSVKRAALREVSVYENQAMTKYLKTIIDDAQFSLPTAKEQIISEFHTALQSAYISGLPNAEISLKNYKDHLKLINLTLPMSVESLSDWEPENLTSEIEEVCEHFAPGHLDDYALSLHGKIHTSWQSVKYPEYGAGIIAHELGHVLSGLYPKSSPKESSTNSLNHKNIMILQKNKKKFTGQTIDRRLSIGVNEAIFNDGAFLKSRQCLTKNHISTNKSEGTSDDSYEEEDWADYFSSKVLNQLSKNNNNLKNFACAFISSDESNYEDLSLENSFSGDTHSSSFLRLLLVEFHRNRLMPSCEKIWQASNSLQTMNSCMQEIEPQNRFLHTLQSF